MKKRLLLHVGFEPPTPDIMSAWHRWFDSIAEQTVDQGGLGKGREISKAGTIDLPWGSDSITSYNIVEAESVEAAEGLARSNPFITSNRIFEIRSP